ncbi:tRNA adenosine(34) deaminase TadA [Motiliproteus sp. MSK22-1]|uniref:tRNA adenosine(34) deaminase TadA n=1 Tax=Motiliproteus sp. MSK22-1 TaxID=1897630 RepID=UPI0009759131|nr:tRNA adenosine(34) deaminase TadA [Motiliproteus sp. MSK22-1]OMH31838.1 tRNA adenosine(34) deaminase TadA [Motiliproteus sp. MSK22-1]
MSERYSDEYWMYYALDLANRAEALGEVPVGAVVVMDNRVVGEGWNRPISGNDPTAHAEIVALRDAAAQIENYRLVDATIYVTIEPCSMCAGALIHSRVSRLVFGAAEPKAGAVGSASNLLDSPWVNYSIEYEGGVLAEECSHRISTFFEKRREQKRLLKQSSDQSGS